MYLSPIVPPIPSLLNLLFIFHVYLYFLLISLTYLICDINLQILEIKFFHIFFCLFFHSPYLLEFIVNKTICTKCCKLFFKVLKQFTLLKVVYECLLLCIFRVCIMIYDFCYLLLLKLHDDVDYRPWVTTHRSGSKCDHPEQSENPEAMHLVPVL